MKWHAIEHANYLPPSHDQTLITPVLKQQEEEIANWRQDPDSGVGGLGIEKPRRGVRAPDTKRNGAALVSGGATGINGLQSGGE